jgi:hypothetical protein
MTVGGRLLVKASSGELGGYVERETTISALVTGWRVAASRTTPVAPGLVVNRIGTHPAHQHTKIITGTTPAKTRSFFSAPPVIVGDKIFLPPDNLLSIGFPGRKVTLSGREGKMGIDEQVALENPPA